MRIGGVDVKPWVWAAKAVRGVEAASRWIGKVDESIQKNLVIPCMLGTGSGWAGVATKELGKHFALIGGFMTKTQRAAGIAGPEGYVAAGFAGCAAGFASAGGYRTLKLAKHLGIVGHLKMEAR